MLYADVFVVIILQSLKIELLLLLFLRTIDHSRGGALHPQSCG
jgi:hypothetical protein